LTVAGYFEVFPGSKSFLDHFPALENHAKVTFAAIPKIRGFPGHFTKDGQLLIQLEILSC
jgi:hypothetical protein